MKKIISVGRGGTGKTSFIAGLSFVLRDKSPLLIIDADPDESLSHFLGAENFKTISEVLFDIKEKKVREEVEKLTLPEKINYLIQQEAIYEGDFFDFISLGVKWSEGCYCQPNNILKGIIKRLEENYNLVLIDSPAGLEHINRRITTDLDYLFILVDPSQKSLESIGRFKKLLQELKIKFKEIFIVANFRYPEDKLYLIEKETGLACIIKLPYDKEVEELTLKGEPFYKLSKNSLFLKKIKELVENLKL